MQKKKRQKLMNKIVVRNMLPEDLAGICEIEKANFSLPWSEKSFLESMEREDTVFLTALLDGEIAGYIGCYCIAGTGEITNVAVDEKYRRQGIGRALLLQLYREGAAHFTEEYFLEVRESNDAAISLYTEMGFVKEGIRKNFYEKPVENAVIMWNHFPLGNRV